LNENPDPLFDARSHTQGGCPHLMELLVAEYREYFQQVNATRKQQDQRPLDPELTIRAARPLLDFFEKYLETYRPVQVFPIDMNYGLVLSNNKRVAVAPGAPNVQGTMQDSGSISVTRGISQPGQDGVVQVNDFGVR
jgi:hypothetical protein